MKNYIKRKIEELIRTGKEPQYESLSVKDFITEFDYATKYLSRLLKVRAFVMYLLLFKRAYFEESKRVVRPSRTGRINEYEVALASEI